MTSVFVWMIDKLSSVRLSLFLLLSLAVASVGGTLSPGADGRFQPYFEHPAIRVLFLGLILNLLTCTVRGIRRQRQRRRFWLEARPEEAGPAGKIISRSMEEMQSDPGIRSFKRTKSRSGFLFEQRRVGRWGVVIVHLSVLAVLIGAYAGGLGYTATLNIYIGDQSRFAYDWDLERDRNLGFSFRLDHFEPRYYPIELRLEIWGPPLESSRMVETKEGESFGLGTDELTARVERFDPDREVLELAVYQRGVYLGPYRVSRRDGVQAGALQPYGLVVSPAAFKDPQLQQLHSDVSVLVDGRVVSSGRVSINHPLTYAGVTIYQTAYNKDPDGNWYAGFQFSKDPGEPLVWAGCVVLIAGLVLVFGVRYRAFLLVPLGENETLFCPVAGRSDYSLSEIMDREQGEGGEDD